MTEKLTVDARDIRRLGPFNVEVIPESGDAIEFALTSSHDRHELDVRPGQYAIIARRTNGEYFHQSVRIEAGTPATLQLSEAKSQVVNRRASPQPATANISPPWHSDNNYIGYAQYLDPGGLKPVEQRDRELTLRVWVRQGEYSMGHVPELFPRQRATYVRVTIVNPCLAVGLMDEMGFGPIVMTPPFRRPLKIQFLAAGMATRAPEHHSNLSVRRTPVALVAPSENAVADILGALSAQAIVHADAIWDQSSKDIPFDEALGYVSGKFEDPAEALLGAHYLLRFLPEKLPLRWADNLLLADKEAADGPVIAAWLRLLSPARDVQDLRVSRIDRDVQRLLTDALSRPKVLFAQTRLLLMQGLRLRSRPVGVLTHLPTWLKRQIVVASRTIRNWPRPNNFLNYAADAGALESFWGTDPFSPGPSLRPSRSPGLKVMSIRLHGSTFDDIASTS
jgi:hypothetical protein